MEAFQEELDSLPRPRLADILPILMVRSVGSDFTLPTKFYNLLTSDRTPDNLMRTHSESFRFVNGEQEIPTEW